MKNQHAVHRGRAVVVTAALTILTAQAQPPSDPAIRSTSGAGETLLLGVDRPADPPGGVQLRGPTPLLLATYPQWDYWNLDTSAVRDSTGLVHFANRLWEYSNSIPNYDRFVFDATGLIETHTFWLGVGGLPAGTDGNGRNFFVRPSGATQHFGAVDSANCIHVFNTALQPTGWEVHYSKLDADGNTLIGWTVLTTDADCWNWYLQPVVTSDGRIIVTWIRNTADICAIVTSDFGVTWSDILVLVPNAGLDQAAALKTVVGSDDALHFVWRTLNWSTNTEKLWYAKARADLSIAVDETVFHVGAAWYPYVSIDDQDSLHITYAPYYDVASTMHYTRLRGDLDLGGSSASDALLTTISEQMFRRASTYVHYPVNQVDERGTVHVVYEQGVYGCLTDKQLYYLRLCALEGDLDCSEAVDDADFARFTDVFAGPDNPAAAGRDPTDFAGADLEGDNDVDLADAAVFQIVFGARS